MKKGFTLLEILIVVTILAILAGAMVPLFNTSRSQARTSKASADLDALKSAAVMYHYDTASWPTGVGGLVGPTSTLTGWNGPYLADWTTDPYGSAYQIYVNASITQAQSYGPDKASNTCGGDDICVQITNNNTR